MRKVYQAKAVFVALVIAATLGGCMTDFTVGCVQQPSGGYVCTGGYTPPPTANAM
jgi:hypothetical protein